jgi:peptidoglycan/LPS O-acetylase OafA/YrhL
MTQATHELGRIKEIDSLRCFAMTAVVAQHCGLLPFGWLGVWQFFAISGFVVTGSVLSRSEEAPAGIRLRNFYARRIARIVPIYYLYIIVGILVDSRMNGRFDLSVFLSLVGFYHNYQMAYSNGELTSWPVGHLWTISVEMQFYVFYGIALVFFGRKQLTALLIGLLMVSPIFRFVATPMLHRIMNDADAAYAIYSGTIFQLDTFAAGALLALHQRFLCRPKIAAWLFGGGLLILSAYAIAYIGVNVAVRHEVGESALRNVVSGILFGEYRQVFIYTVVAATATGTIAMAVSHHKLLRPILALPTFQWIGVISYGAYIYHSLAIECCRWMLGMLSHPSNTVTESVFKRILLFISVYIFTVLLAQLSFHVMERPLMRAMSHWLRRDASARAAVVSAKI